jgi:hypothetical protein
MWNLETRCRAHNPRGGFFERALGHPVPKLSRKKMKNTGGQAKTCRKCGETKEADEFRRNPRCRDGLSSWCSACDVEATRRYRRRKAAERAEAQERRRKEHNRRLREQVQRHREPHCGWKAA